MPRGPTFVKVSRVLLGAHIGNKVSEVSLSWGLAREAYRLKSTEGQCAKGF